MNTAPKLPPIVLIGGPTASGKSAVALALAQHFAERGQPSVILNGDALQLYRDLRVLTARPDAEEEAQAHHRLYGVLDGAERGSVARWLDMAREEVATALAEGFRVIVVGGSGLYLHALPHGLSPIPEIDPEARAEAMARHAELGGVRFRAELAQLDPVSAARLHDGDTQRLTRAYEVVKSTGRTLPDWQAEPLERPPESWRFRAFVIEPPRAALYAACDGRFDKMLEQGALDEVQALLKRTLAPDLPVMKAVGVPELAAVLRGELPLAAARSRAQQVTRNYAKRQLTWFRHQLEPAVRLSVLRIGDPAEARRLANEIGGMAET